LLRNKTIWASPILIFTRYQYQVPGRPKNTTRGSETASLLYVVRVLLTPSTRYCTRHKTIKKYSTSFFPGLPRDDASWCQRSEYRCWQFNLYLCLPPYCTVMGTSLPVRGSHSYCRGPRCAFCCCGECHHARDVAACVRPTAAASLCMQGAAKECHPALGTSLVVSVVVAAGDWILPCGIAFLSCAFASCLVS
jgi:hypothetical protein